MSVCKAAKLFCVPEQTLRDRVAISQTSCLVQPYPRLATIFTTLASSYSDKIGGVPDATQSMVTFPFTRSRKVCSGTQKSLAALQTDICSSLTAINASDNALKSYDLGEKLNDGYILSKIVMFYFSK
jgi:hypothetical protein